jgi:hypothetical protein
MIEINLVPDVKQELIRAKRIRTIVVSTTVLIGLVVVAIVILLAVYLFAVQTVRNDLANKSIAEKNAQLANIDDLSETLTIQHQLAELSRIYDQTNIDSRFFDLLAAINPSAPNQVSFSMARIDTETKTVRLEGQAVNGYIAADVLKKTILGTDLSYKEDNESKTVELTDEVSTSDLSYGEDATGKKVLRFTMSFVYNDAFFARSSQNAIIVRPDRQNVTDSYLRLPESLFVDRAGDTGGSE